MDPAAAAADVAAAEKAEAGGGDRIEHRRVLLPEAARFLAGVQQAVFEHGVALDAPGVVDGDEVAQPVKMLGLQRTAVTLRQAAVAAIAARLLRRAGRRGTV